MGSAMKAITPSVIFGDKVGRVLDPVSEVTSKVLKKHPILDPLQLQGSALDPSSQNSTRNTLLGDSAKR